MSDFEVPGAVPDPLEVGMDEERLVMGRILQGMQGQNVISEPNPLGPPQFDDTFITDQVWRMEQSTRQMNQQIFLNEQSGWSELSQFWQGVIEQYKTQNAAVQIKRAANEQQWLEQAQQSQPVTVDPNVLANMRGIAAKIQAQGKAIDPSFDFFTDPRTKHIGQWINRESGQGTAGFLREGEQRAELGAVGTVWMAVAEAAEGVMDFGTNTIHGVYELGRAGILALGGPDVGPSFPYNYVQGPDGKLYDNGGRAPAFMDTLVMMGAAITGDNIEQKVAEFRAAREWEVAQRDGIDTIILGGSRIIGMGFGFGAPAGAAMKVGQKTFGELVERGMTNLATLRLTGAVGMSERGRKVIRTISGAMGAAVGNGVAETMAYGRIDGYGASFVHGMTMAPVLMALGAMGKRTEWFAEHRAKMPRRVAQLVGGAMEGVGFGALEAHAPDLLPSAWGFIQNPNEETWETYAKNAVGFMLFKAATGGRPFLSSENQLIADAASQQVRRSMARQEFAERAVRGEADPEAISKTGMTPEQLSELDFLSKVYRRARTPAGREAARKELTEFEASLDVQELSSRSPQGEVDRILAAEDTAEAVARETPRETTEEIESLGMIARDPQRGSAERMEATRKIRTIEEQSRREAGEVEAIGKAGEASLEFRQSEATDQPWTHEWTIRDQKGAVIGRGFYTPKGKQFVSFSADIVPEHQGKGLFSEVMKRMAAKFPDGGATAQDLQPAARRAWEKAGLEPRELRGEALEVRPSEDVGVRKGMPESGDWPPYREVAGTRPAGEPGVRQSDIFLAMEGQHGGKGLRIPFTAKRIGGSDPDRVRTKIRGGFIKGKELGHFKFHENLIRTKEGRDIVVAAHEWSHAMHRHMIGESGHGYLRAGLQQAREAVRQDSRIIDEMDAMLQRYGSGPAKMPLRMKWAESWAEWHARNLLGDPHLAAKYPSLSQWHTRFLAAAENAALRPQYLRIQQLIASYNAQGARGRVRMERVHQTDQPTAEEQRHKPGVVERLKTVLDKAWLDDMAEMKKSQDKWLEAVGRKPEDVDITSDPARLYDALRMTASKTAEHYILNGIRLPSGGKIPGMAEVLKDFTPEETADFLDHVTAVINMQRMKRGRKAMLPPSDYIETIRQTNTPKIRTAARALKKWTDALVDYVQQSGAIDVDTASRIKDAYVVYVPMFRVMEGPAAHGRGRGIAERGTGLHRAKGSQFEIQDPLRALQDTARSLIAKAHQHQVMTALYKMAAGHEVGGLATMVQPKNVPHEHSVKRVLELLQEKLGDAELDPMLEALQAADALNPQTITLFTQKTMPTDQKAMIAYTPRLTEREINGLTSQGAAAAALRRQNGKVVWMEVDTKVYEALMGIDKMPQLPESMQPVMKWLQAPRDVIRFFATGIQPAFTVANLVRDAMSQPMFDPQGRFRPFGGFARLWRGAKLYHEGGAIRDLYEELGVKTASFLNEGRARQLAGQHPGIMHGLKEWTDKAQRFLATPESYLRMDAFKEAYDQARARGSSETEARMLALEAGREITVNFARAGVYGRILNQIIPYFNAGLQGQRKLFGQLLQGGVDTKGEANKARVQRAAWLNGMANITVPAVFLWAMNKDEEWYQDLPDWRKVYYFNMKIGGQIISIPKPFEAGTIFGSLPEMMLDRMVGNDPAGLREIASSVMGPYFDVMPAFAKPLYEVWTNYSFFTGRDLTPDWILRSQKPQEQATFMTSESAKLMSRVMNGVLTPIEIEHLLGGYTAGTSTAVLRTLDEVTGAKDHPAFSPTGISMFRRFYSQQVHGQSRYVDELYGMRTDITQREDELSVREKSLKRRVDTAVRQLSDLRKAAREGRMSQEEANKRSYELARRIVERN